MTVIEKLENKIDLTNEELNDIVHDCCSSITELVEEIYELGNKHQLVSTYFKVKNGKWYQLNWRRVLIKTQGDKFLEQPFEVKREVMQFFQRDIRIPVFQRDIWTPVE